MPAKATPGGRRAVPGRLSPAAPVLAACVLFWLFLLFAGPTPGTPSHAVGRDLPFSYYRDADDRLDLAGFLALPAHALKAGDKPLSQGYDEATYWMRFAVPASAFDGQELWLVLSPNYLDTVTLFMNDGDPDGWRTRHAGDRDQLRASDLPYRFPVYRLAPPPDGQPRLDVVLRVHTTSAVIVEPALWTPTAFFAHATFDTATWSFYFGVAAFSSALALLLAIGLGSRLLWSLVPFSLGYLLAACIQGYVGWSTASWRLAAQDIMTGVLMLWGAPALMWMCIEALEVRRHFPRLYRVLIAIVLASLLLPLSIPMGWYGVAARLLTAGGLAIAGVVLGLGVAIWRRQGASLVTLGIGVLPLFYVSSAALALLMATAVLPYDARLYMLWQYSTMLVMTVTVLAVMFIGVQRIRHEQRERHAHESLARELARERAASFHQRQFMAMVSHEFRTPLAVISGTLENLAPADTADARVRQRHDKIQRAVGRLVQLTDNCMADARLTADTLYLDRQPVDLLAELRQAAQVAERSDAHCLRISVQGEDVAAQATPLPTVPADAALLRIALSNLLDNAIKHTRDGQVWADVRLGDGVVHIDIRDEGPGIAVEQAEEVFERYRRGGRPDTTRPAGSGLGLFVARQIARSHGGDLVLAENTPQGCRFTLTLPLTAPALQG